MSRTEEQKQNHNEKRQTKRDKDSDYKATINAQQKIRYQKKRLPEMLSELKEHNIKTESSDYDTVHTIWKKLRDDIRKSTTRRPEVQQQKSNERRKNRRNTDEEYHNRVNTQARNRYRLKRIPEMITELELNGINLPSGDSKNYDIVFAEWKKLCNKLSKERKESRYAVFLKKSKDRYSKDEEYRKAMINKSANKDKLKRQIYVKNLELEVKTLKKKLGVDK